MGFWGTMLKGLGTLAGSIIGGPAGGAIGGAIGSVGSNFIDGNKNKQQKWQGVADSFAGAVDSVTSLKAQGYSEKEAKEYVEQQQKLQFERQKELMGLQYQYNDKAADKAHQRQLEYWNNTNWEAQVRHARNAGMSVGLLYGQGGPGGSTGAAPMGSVSGASAPNAGTAAEGMGLGLQARKQAAEINLMEAQANKANADANKTSGVDTDEAKSRIKLNESEAKLNEAIEAVKWTEKNERAANYFKIQAEEQKIWKEVEAQVMDNEITRETKESIIAQRLQGFMMNTIAMIEGISRVELNKAQVEYIGKQIQYYAYEVTTRRMTAEAAKENAATFMDKITNDFILGDRKLDQEDTRILQDWIFRSIQGLTSVAQAAGNLIGIFKGPISEVIETATEEIFGPNGERKGWKRKAGKVVKTVKGIK